jgi:hypothetical protein
MRWLSACFSRTEIVHRSIPFRYLPGRPANVGVSQLSAASCGIAFNATLTFLTKVPNLVSGNISYQSAT